jgi:hypothetical protein
MALKFTSILSAVRQYFNFDKEINIQHQVALVAQHEGEESWTAAVNMLRAKYTSTMPSHKGRGYDMYNIVTFARLNGFRLYAPQKWDAQRFVSLIQKGPIAIGGLSKGAAFVVISGIKSNGKAENTFFTIFSPTPLGIGTFQPMVSFDLLKRQFPEMTTCILQ